MIVVADTTPLNYLILIDAAHVLPVLFGRVCIPKEVEQELARPSAPASVRRWIGEAPAWLEIMAVEVPSSFAPSMMASLDPGESAALALALVLRPEFLLIDERSGRRAARELGLQTTGTLGVLEMATAKGLVDMTEVIGRLKETNFRYPHEIVERLLAEDVQRKQGST